MVWRDNNARGVAGQRWRRAWGWRFADNGGHRATWCSGVAAPVFWRDITGTAKGRIGEKDMVAKQTASRRQSDDAANEK